MVTVRIHGPETPKELSEYSTEASVKNLGELLAEMAGSDEYYNRILIRDGVPRTELSILINGRSCMFLGGLQARVGKGDTVDILLPMIGG